MKSDDSTFGYVSVNALMEFAKNHVDGKVDCNDIARFPRVNVRNADEQQSLQQIFGISYSRLRELADAEKEGRVVVLPDCKKCKNYAARDALYPQCIGVVYPCEGCVGLIKIKRYPNNKFEPESALSSVINQVDRCSTCDNNGKSICAICIMTGHGNDIDFYRSAGEGEKSDG